MPAIEQFNYVAVGFLLGNLAADHACYAHISVFLQNVEILSVNISCTYFLTEDGAQLSVFYFDCERGNLAGLQNNRGGT